MPLVEKIKLIILRINVDRNLRFGCFYVSWVNLDLERTVIVLTIGKSLVSLIYNIR